MHKILVALAILTPLAAVPSAIAATAYAATAQTSALGDLGPFEAIATDTLALVQKNDLIAAQNRITDFETAWDKAEPVLYSRSPDQWSDVDTAADGAISALRDHPSTRPAAEAAVNTLLTALKHPAAH